MNIFEVKKTFSSTFPDDEIEVDLDVECICGIEIPFVNGQPNLFGHIIFNRAKIKTSTSKSFFVEIDCHRQAVCFKDIKEKISNCTGVNIPKDVIDNMKAIEDKSEYDKQLKALVESCGMDEKDLNKIIKRSF